MFGLGILTYIKIGAVVVVLSVCGYYVWNYHHLQSKVAAQQILIDSLKMEQDIQAKKQKAFDDFMAKRTIVKRRVVQDEQQSDEVVNSGDTTRVIDMFHRLRPDQNRNASDGKSRGVKDSPGRKASP